MVHENPRRMALALARPLRVLLVLGLMLLVGLTEGLDRAGRAAGRARARPRGVVHVTREVHRKFTRLR
jgi:hypothetical protein